MLSDVIHCLSGGSTLPPLDGTFLQAPRERVIGFCFAMESAQRAGKSVIDLWRPTPAPCASRESCAKVNCSNGETWLSLDLKTRGKLDVRTNGFPDSWLTRAESGGPSHQLFGRLDCARSRRGLWDRHGG